MKKGKHQPGKLGKHSRGQRHSLVIKKENGGCKVVKNRINETQRENGEGGNFPEG